MIGERLKQARVAAGLTLDEVVARIPRNISKAVLSKYELGKSSPSADLLGELAKALDVAPGFFFKESPTINWGEFRKKSTLTQKHASMIQARATHEVENLLWLEHVLCLSSPRQLPNYSASSPAEAENAAALLRQRWNLGSGPIESLSMLAEDQGVCVVEFEDETGKMDGLSAIVDPEIPLVLVRRVDDLARFRLTLAHELGHLVLRTPHQPGKLNEDIQYRFGAALLVPEDTARRELGSRRRTLEVGELILLKQKYGLSMQAWLRRALDLSIIDRGHYETWCRHISVRGWRKKEPAKYDNPLERPSRLQQLVLRAVGEGLIDSAQALEACPKVQGLLNLSR